MLLCRGMPHLSRDEGSALLERWHRYLRDHHLPLTRQRDLVAKVVFGAEEHLSVEQIERKLRAQGARIGTATLYRTIQVLVQSGLVREHDFGEGFRRYEPLPSQSHHEHLICLRCGAVAEFQNERLERMIPIIADEHDFQPQRHRVEIYGLCRACRQRDLGAFG